MLKKKKILTTRKRISFKLFSIVFREINSLRKSIKSFSKQNVVSPATILRVRKVNKGIYLSLFEVEREGEGIGLN